jgi:hypothetical protein
MPERIWTLAPVDLGDLWEDCRRCFYLGLARGFPRPGGALRDPLERHLGAQLAGRRSESVAAGLAAGTLEVGHRSVQSGPIAIQVPDNSYRCVIRGAVELLIAFDDATLGVVELAAGGETGATARARRLHAWAHALESAGAGKVSALGVLVFEPASRAPTTAAATLSGAWRWVPVERDDPTFYGVLAEALSLLERPEPPGGAPLCPWCVYRDASRRTGY